MEEVGNYEEIMNFYVENPRESSKNNKYGIFARHKINTQKSVAFLYYNNYFVKEFKKITLLILASKKNYLGINVKKWVKYLHTENYEIFPKEINEDKKKYKDIPCSWIGILNIVKMSIPLNAIYRFNAISIKIPTAFSLK